MSVLQIMRARQVERPVQRVVPYAFFTALVPMYVA